MVNPIIAAMLKARNKGQATTIIAIKKAAIAAFILFSINILIRDNLR